MEQRIKVNPSTPRPGGRGLLRVDPERVNDWILEEREPQRTPGISVDKRV